VFVVLFLPTSASARSSRSTFCTASNPSFIGTSWQWVTKGDYKGYLQVFVSHADAVDHVHFTAEKGYGSHWVSDYIEHSDRWPSLNSVFVEVPSAATDGPIRINHSSEPGVCYVQSNKTFHPQGGHS
jgi:hypothetical protein